MKQRLYRSAHLAEIFFPKMNDEQDILEIVERIADLGFYQGIEIGVIHQPKIASAIKSVAERNNMRVTQWMTFELLKHGLNLSSLDKSLREKSIKHACEVVKLAADCGTSKLSLVSGADPGEALRDEAKKVFGDALIEIGEAVNQYPNMLLQVEPLDRFAHKCHLIGPTDETVVWMNDLRRSCPQLHLAWDSAHVALNEEDLFESLALAAPLMSQLHLANAILDPKVAGYGDYHMKFGQPGFLTPEVAAKIIRAAQALSFPAAAGDMSIAVEMRTTDQDDLWDNERQCREFLQTAFEQAAAD